MAKMDDERLLTLLQNKEDLAGDYVWNTLGRDREQAMRHYYRLPYGTEEEGWSQVVTSDVQDAIEWILPDLLDQFLMTDQAVCFEPTRAKDVEGAAQATDTVNYVFMRQNPGFLILYTAIKDALMVRNCAVMWRKEEKEVVSSVPFKGASQDMLAMLMSEAGEDAEVENVEIEPMLDMQGRPVSDALTGEPIALHSGRIKRTEKRKMIKVEAFSPEDLLVEKDWQSPLLDDCPYVARMMSVTLSDLHEMGFKDVEPADLLDTDATARSADADLRLSKVNSGESTSTAGLPTNGVQSDDESMTSGWLRMEWVLVDYDGDGVAERRQILRLKEKILSNETVAGVPIATASPLLNPHRWDGMSLDDIVADIQELHTELMRGTLNNVYLTNNPRKKVLVDATGAPRADIDDLLDSRPGGVLRQFQSDAIQDDVTPFTAGATMPVMEYVKQMREDRTGVSRASMGLDPNSLNTTATGRRMDKTSSQKRIALMARIFAEVLLKPVFHGILKLLTEGDMQRMAFRLRGEFVEYDPSEWRDHYDMTTNIGLGTGDKEAQRASLTTLMQAQMALQAQGITLPKHIHHTFTKLVELAGFKDIENFGQKPPDPDPNAPKPPPLEVQLEMVRQQGKIAQIQTDSKIRDAEHQRQMDRDIIIENNRQEAQARDTAHTATLDAQREMAREREQTIRERAKLELQWHQSQLEALTKIFIAQLGAQNAPEEAPGGPQETSDGQGEGDDTRAALAASVQALHGILSTINAPKMILKDAQGRPIGIAPQPMPQPGAV